MRVVLIVGHSQVLQGASNASYKISKTEVRNKKEH